MSKFTLTITTDDCQELADALYSLLREPVNSPSVDAPAATVTSDEDAPAKKLAKKPAKKLAKKAVVDEDDDEDEDEPPAKPAKKAAETAVVDEDDDEDEDEPPAKPAKKAVKKPVVDEDDDDDDDEAPAKKPTKKPAKTVVDDDEDDDAAEEQRTELRKALRKLSGVTNRKTAVKVLNKFGKSVDEVPVADIDSALIAISIAISEADESDDE